MFTDRPEPPDWWWEYNFGDPEFVGEVYDEDEEELWLGNRPQSPSENLDDSMDDIPF